MPDSFGCGRCYGEDPRVAWAYYEEGLAVERELVGDSHFLVQLRRCADCGQQFVWIFGEAIDWEAGEDAQRREIVPVSAAEAEAAGTLDYPSLAALGVDRRYLQTDWPTDSANPTVGWSTGELRLPRSRLGLGDPADVAQREVLYKLVSRAGTTSKGWPRNRVRSP